MRVVHVVPDLSPASGGQTVAALGLSEALIAAGLSVDVATTDYGIKGLTHTLGTGLHTVQCVFPRWRWAPSMFGILKPLLARARLCHIHGLWLHPTWAAARLCREVGVPYLVSPCGMLENWSLSQKAFQKRVYAFFLERYTLKGAAAIHFTTDAERERSRTFGSLARKCVVPLGVPRTAWENLPPRGRFRQVAGLANGAVVLFLGRLHPKKQPDLLVRAFAKVAGWCRDLTLVLAGPGDVVYLNRLRNLARALGVEDRVLFPGVLRGRAVQEALVDADVFVLPSLQENFGLAVSEAMAAGRPVIVSPQVALAYDVERQGAGLVVDAKLEPLTEALRQLLGDRDLRLFMGENGRKTILEHYTWERVSRQVIELYDDMRRETRTSAAWR